MTIWIAYFLAAAVACGALIVAARRRTHEPVASTGMPVDPLWAEPDLDLTEEAPQTDASAAIRMALTRAMPVLTECSVHADIAAPPGLLVRMRGSMLTDAIEELLSVAAHGAPGRWLLITATGRGDHVEISVTDDVFVIDPALRAAAVRDVIERMALRGATLTVRSNPGEGTTMTLRLARFRQRRAADRADLARPEMSREG